MKRVTVYKDAHWLVRDWRWRHSDCGANAGEISWRRAFDAAFRHAQACPGHP